MILNLLYLNKSKEDIKSNYNYDADDIDNSSPFINYILEDKSSYPFIDTIFNDETDQNYIDRDRDFKLGRSGGLLMNIDFVFVNTHLYSQAADYFTKFKSYCLHDEDTLEYKEFWAQELGRRQHGYTQDCKLYIKDIEEYYNPKTTEKRKKQLIYPLHITGNHYSYLNYGRIERTPNAEEKQELINDGANNIETIEGFPRFWDGDYWFYKTDQFCSNNKLSNIVAKSRRKGYSYKNGNITANTLNLNKNLTVINVADNIDFLTDKGSLTYMAKTCLDWYENNTYWQRGYLSEKLDSLELGYKRDTESNKPYGFRSKLLSYSIGRNINVAIGKKAIKINCEESGACPNLKKFLEVTSSNMESGRIKIGTFSIWGTGGTKGSNWEYFETIFNKPASIKAVAFENVWDRDKRHTTCGFFHANIWNYEPYVVDGNSLLFDSYLYDKKDKEKMSKSGKPIDQVITYCAQRANSPSEAFINTVENLFASTELNIHVTELKTDTTKQFYKDGWYIKDNGTIKFVDKRYCIENDVLGHNMFHEFITDVPHKNTTDIHGCVREYYAPYTDKDGRVPKDLYFIVADPYGVDKKASEVTDKHSLYSFSIWMRSNTITPYSGKRLVAEYAGRLNTMKDNDNLTLLACLRWNCSLLVESNRGETIPNFKLWHCVDRLLYDPTEFTENSLSTGGKGTKLGMVVGTGDVKMNGLTMIKDFIYEVLGVDILDIPIIRLTEIFSLPLCLELQRFTSTGNFDRLSTMILAMYEFKKDEFIKRSNLFKSVNTNNKTKSSFAERLNRH